MENSQNILKKTHEKSFFKYFEYQSQFSNTVLTKDSCYAVLQIMPCENKFFLCELVLKADLTGKGDKYGF